uniref:Uncharacterized protein n=1 Tax=Glossina austeni TaxID=7395 RepID=A0A1A9VUI2_GLOAU
MLGRHDIWTVIVISLGRRKAADHRATDALLIMTKPKAIGFEQRCVRGIKFFYSSFIIRTSLSGFILCTAIISNTRTLHLFVNVFALFFHDIIIIRAIIANCEHEQSVIASNAYMKSSGDLLSELWSSGSRRSIAFTRYSHTHK